MARKATDIGQIEFSRLPAPGKGLALDGRGRIPQNLVAMALIERKKLESAASSVSFLNIPDTFEMLLLVGSFQNDTGAVVLNMTLNNDTSAVYYSQHLTVNNTTVTGFENNGGSSSRVGSMGAATARWSNTRITLYNYVADNIDCNWQYECFRSDGDTSGNHFIDKGGGAYNNTARITRIDLAAASNNLVATSKFALYGLNATVP